jgi:hypothetical protein
MRLPTVMLDQSDQFAPDTPVLETGKAIVPNSATNTLPSC